MNKRTERILIAVYALLFAYVVIRAAFLSFTFDESLSFRIIHGDINLERTANHHFLNTWLMRVFSFCSGDSELSLRAPNVLSMILYLFYTHKLLRLINLPLVCIIALPFILFNPFILDFFSLARGYGLSMAFMMAALFHLVKFLTTEKENIFLKDVVLVLVFSTLSMAANLSLVNFHIATLVLIAGKYLFNFRETTFRPFQFLLTIVAGLIPLFLAMKRLIFLKQAGELYFGTGDFNSTMDSLLERSFYFSPYPSGFANVIKDAAIYSLPAGLLLFFFKKHRNDFYLGLTALYVLILAGLVIEHHLFDALYPVGRTGIFLIPLFGLFFALFISELHRYLNERNKKIASFVLAIVFALPMTFHFLKSANFKYTFEWKHDMYTRDVALMISKNNQGQKEKQMVAVNWIFEPTMDYYNKSRKLNLDIVKWTGKEPSNLVFTTNDNALREDWRRWKDFEEINAGLFYRIVPIPKEKNESGK